MRKPLKPFSAFQNERLPESMENVPQDSRSVEELLAQCPPSCARSEQGETAEPTPISPAPARRSLRPRSVPPFNPMQFESRTSKEFPGEDVDYSSCDDEQDELQVDAPTAVQPVTQPLTKLKSQPVVSPPSELPKNVVVDPAQHPMGDQNAENGQNVPATAPSRVSKTTESSTSIQTSQVPQSNRASSDAFEGVRDDAAQPDPCNLAIDSKCFDRFRQIGKARLSGPGKTIKQGGSSVRYWSCGKFLFGFVELAPVGQPAARVPSPIKLGPNVYRLLLAVHARVLATGQLTVRMSYDHVAERLWGRESLRPNNWRASIKSAARVLNRLQGFDGKRFNSLVRGVVDRFNVIQMTVQPLMLGNLENFIGPAGQIQLVRSVPSASRKITSKDLEQLRCEDPSLSHVNDTELREILRERRKEEANKPSLQLLAREKKVKFIFLPAFLGEPALCREVGDLANLLFREQTRLPKLVENALVPDWSTSSKIVCPFLNVATNYVAFAANRLGGGSKKQRSNPKPGTDRAGRGYKLQTWADRLGVTIDDFLAMLTAAAPRLQLTPAALDSENQWHDLDAIRSADTFERSKWHLRIYTPDGHITRWCRLFGWPELDEAKGQKQIKGELAELAGIAKSRGVRRIAREIGADASNLSKILSGQRRGDAQLIAKLRHALRGSQPLGGTGTGTIFGDCHTPKDYALAYRKLCWSVIPIIPGTKRALVEWKPYQTHLPTPNEIRHWWNRWPDANVGLILGHASGIFAIDVDGEEAHKVLIEHLGIEPVAPKVMSGSGDPDRTHLIFRHPELWTKAKFTPWNPHLEFRGNRGLLILPPSLHASGNRYRWVGGQSIEEIQLPELPGQVKAALEPKPLKAVTPAAAPQAGPVVHFQRNSMSEATAEFLAGKYCEGPNWNQRLYVSARELKARGWTIDGAREVLIKGARPWDAAEKAKAMRTIESAYERDTSSRIGPLQA